MSFYSNVEDFQFLQIIKIEKKKPESWQKMKIKLFCIPG